MDSPLRFGPCRTFALLLVACLGLSAVVAPAASAQYATVIVPGQGGVYCSPRPLPIGNITLRAGTCFKLAALRDSTGTYLAFLRPTAPIMPDQIASAAQPPDPNAPRFVVPVTATAALPLNTMTLIPARIETRGAETRVIAMGGALATTIVINAETVVTPVSAEPAAPAAGPVVFAAEGQVFCPSSSLVAGDVVIPTGDCYRLAMIRNVSGTFLAFVPQAIALPAERVVAFSAPAMGAVASRAYLIPLPAARHAIGGSGARADRRRLRKSAR
jgi:hypothetical protein